MFYKIGKKGAAIINGVLEKTNLSIVCHTHHFMDNGKNFPFGKTFDPIRLSMLNLLAHEIHKNNIPGAVAELGVYRGEFAKHINRTFKNQKFYMFDTFEGFDKKEAEADYKSGDAKILDNFANTSVKHVLSKMKHPEKCIIKKGFFPDTAKDVTHEKFCFVSLDVDLLAPTLAGLSFFYDRLSPGGYIMIHDYNNKLYKGTGKAISSFCQERKITLFPVPDVSGSAVIAKGIT